MKERLSTPGGIVIARRDFGVALGIGALAWLVAPSARAGDSPVKQYLGKYDYAGGDREREARDKAIDDVVAGMSILVRGIARDRLKSSNPIASVLAFSSDSKSLTISADSRTYTAPLDGSAVKVKGITGDEMDLHLSIGTDQLDQVFSADDRGRTNRYVVDGSKLSLKVRVWASKLPKDLVYRLTYERS